MNNLPFSVKFSQTFMIADDTKFPKQMQSLSDLGGVGKQWGMHFNEAKSVHIR